MFLIEIYISSNNCTKQNKKKNLTICSKIIFLANIKMSKFFFHISIVILNDICTQTDFLLCKVNDRSYTLKIKKSNKNNNHQQFWIFHRINEKRFSVSIDDSNAVIWWIENFWTIDLKIIVNFLRDVVCAELLCHFEIFESSKQFFCFSFFYEIKHVSKKKTK